MNFVWVYGSEAHPQEYPFQSGFESTDLGWEHPYSITETMEQRAQRASWLKTDLSPEAEMPIMVDYINSPDGQPNNAIRGAYRGGGFYSGYVIDCDRTILDANRWAWFGEGGQWWDLPLRPIEDLHALLDDYLEDPPDCFDP